VPCFDEEDFRFTVLYEYGAKQASEMLPFIHLNPRRGHFWFRNSIPCNRILGWRKKGSPPFVMTWQNGDLTGWFAVPGMGVKTLKLAYVHFFKRDIRTNVKRLERGITYLITPKGIDVYTGKYPLTYWRIRWLNRPRIHWKYMMSRLTLTVFKRKICSLVDFLLFKRKKCYSIVRSEDC